VRLRQEVQALPRDAGLIEPLGIGPGTTRAEARVALAALMAARGFDQPQREAALLLRRAAGFRAADMIAGPETELGEAAAARVAAFAERRAAGEPLSRICGRRAFWSLDLAISSDVLDPRPETETIVEAAISEMAGRREAPLRVLDLGVGSGALLCALLSEFPQALGLGVDLSERAAAIARANLEALGLAARATIRVGDWGDGLESAFDLIVSNPPYVRSDEIAGLDREVRDHDPRLALDGGEDGLQAYRALAPQLARLLEPAEGRFFLEFGEGQAEAVRAILEAGGLEISGVVADLSGRARVVFGRRMPS
jgi:release factor glutamine methyltransferase